MPQRNYGFEKRQKELNRQQKQEQKRQRRREQSEPLAQNSSENDEIAPETPSSDEGESSR